MFDKILKVLRMIIFTIGLFVVAPTLAYAALAVVDSAAIAKLSKQLSEAKKRFEELVAIKTLGEEQLNAMGVGGEIAVSLINATKIKNQLKRDVQCLLPDLEKLMPDADFDELEFPSICEAANAYLNNLWVQPDDLHTLTVSKQRDLVKKIKERRDNVLAEAASKGLGQADISQKVASDANDTASELEAVAQLPLQPLIFY